MLPNRLWNCDSVTAGSDGGAATGRVSATQHRMLESPGHRSLNVPPVHSARSMHSPENESNGVVHEPREADVSGGGGRNEPLGGAVVADELGQHWMSVGPGHLLGMVVEAQLSMRVHVPSRSWSQVLGVTPAGYGQHRIFDGPGQRPVLVGCVHE